MKKIELSVSQIKRIKKTLSKDKVENDKQASGELKSELARILAEYMYINSKTLRVCYDKNSAATTVTITVTSHGFKPVISIR